MTNSFLRSVLGDLYSDREIAAEFGAPAFTKRMLRFEAAWTRALAAEGLVSSEDAAVSLRAIESFERHDFAEGSLSDGVPVPALVRALRSGLEEGPSKAIHTGATSQDVVDTAMALTLVRVTELLRKHLEDLVRALDGVSRQFGAHPLMARTRMQAALPATAELRINAWQQAVEEQLKRSDDALAEIAVAQVGGPIGLRDGPDGKGPAIAERVSRELGLELTGVWHTDRSGPVSFGHWLTLVCGTMGKIGQDIALMAQQGISEIELSGGGGSSAMPHKQNPISAEAMVTLARYVAVQQGALAQAMVHEQERSGAAWALEWMTLPAMAEATGAALRHGVTVVSRIERVGVEE